MERVAKSPGSSASDRFARDTPVYHGRCARKSVSSLPRTAREAGCGQAADLSGPDPALLPAPVSDSLVDPASGGQHPVPQLEPAAIPQDGLRVERRAILARATTGDPILWTQRRRLPLLAPATFALRFDVLEPVGSPVEPP